jgi:hypothetical protein
VPPAHDELDHGTQIISFASNEQCAAGITAEQPLSDTDEVLSRAAVMVMHKVCTGLALSANGKPSK